MKLVGASWSFIRRPFLRSAVCVGVIAAILANIVLGACFYALYLTQPGILSIVGWEELSSCLVCSSHSCVHGLQSISS